MTDTPPPPPAPRKPPMIFKLILLGFVLVVCFVVAEIAVRILRPELAAGPALTQADAYYGYWLKPNISRDVVNSKGSAYHISTNSLGHRAPEYRDAPAGSIVCLGDSYTMGDAVDDGQEYASLLRERFAPRGYEVINFGKAGNGNGRWIRFLERDAEGFDPAVVVMQICFNDFIENPVESLYVVGPDGSLEARPVPEIGMARRAQAIVESVPGVVYLRLYQLAKQIVRGSGSRIGQLMLDEDDFSETIRRDDPALWESRNELTFAIIERAVEMCRENGWPVVAINVGTEGERERLLFDLFDRLGVRAIDIPLRSERPELFHEKDPHWNAAGQRHVASVLGEAIDEALSPGESD